MRIARTVLAVAATAGLLTGVAGQSAHATTADLDGIALYSGGTKLARFDTDEPSRSKKIGDVTRLDGDTALIGIDRRVQNGRLYGVGNEGGIYLLSVTKGTARKVGRLSVALEGTSFGVDFNPAANALRIVGDTGQNLRQPFGDGEGPTAPTVADGTLNYLTVTAPGVSAAAYTNNDLSPDSATSLFDVDTTLDQIVLQSPANSGALAATGKLGVDAAGDVGFDIHSDLRSGRASANHGFLVINHRLHSVDLLTGQPKYLGKFNKSVTDIALDLDK